MKQSQIVKTPYSLPKGSKSLLQALYLRVSFAYYNNAPASNKEVNDKKRLCKVSHLPALFGGWTGATETFEWRSPTHLLTNPPFEHTANLPTSSQTTWNLQPLIWNCSSFIRNHSLKLRSQRPYHLIVFQKRALQDQLDAVQSVCINTIRSHKGATVWQHQVAQMVQSKTFSNKTVRLIVNLFWSSFHFLLFSSWSSLFATFQFLWKSLELVVRRTYTLFCEYN